MPDQPVDRRRPRRDHRDGTLAAAIDHSSLAIVCRYLNKHSPGAAVATGSRSP
jgi:hypothetical protein